MTPNRWEEVNRFYDAALDVAEAEREVFLREPARSDQSSTHECSPSLTAHWSAEFLF